MATTYDLSGSLLDAGVPFATGRPVQAWVALDNAAAIIEAATGALQLGRWKVDIDSLGAISETLPSTASGAGWLPDGGFAYRLFVQYRDSAASAERETFISAAFTLTEDRTLADALGDTIELTAISAVEWADFQAKYDELKDVIATTEGVMTAVDADAGSSFRVQQDLRLSATIAEPDGAVMERTTKTTFYDDFTTKADAVVASGGSYVSASGHTVQVTGQLGLTVASGRGTSVRTNTATVQSTYLTADLGVDAGDQTGYLYVETEVPAGADPIQSLGLIVPEGTFGPPDFTDCSAHCIFDAAAFHNSSLEALGAGAFTATSLGRGQYATLPAGTYRFEVTIDGREATVTDPYGKRWPCAASDFNVTRTAGLVTLQWYAAVGTFKGYKVLRWGAELQDRAKRGSYVAASDLGKVATQPGRIRAAMQSSGASTATAMTTSLSAKLLGQFIPIPVSRRILIEANLWFDETVPVVRTASALLVGAYLGGGTTYGKLTTVQSGYTPANATLDPLTGSKTHDWASVADGALASTTVTVTGAALGNVASASMNVALPAGVQLSAAVTAADTVTVTLVNHSGSAQDLASGTLRATAQGAPTSYVVGRLVPFALILDVDTAFVIGDSIEVQIKAQASAASLFTFIDSGDASGGTSTLRRSTMKITELAPA